MHVWKRDYPGTVAKPLKAQKPAIKPIRDFMKKEKKTAIDHCA